MTAPVARFAPSPNGYLHIGHAYSALLNQRFVNEHGGHLLLRIEDVDTTRARPEFEQAIRDDLAWLGIAWEEPARRQSENVTDYHAALEKLGRMGVLYPCYCTRRDIRSAVGAAGDMQTDPDGSPIYPGTCRPSEAESLPDLSILRRSGRRHALRLNMNRALELVSGPVAWREYREGEERCHAEFDPLRWGDVTVGRKDIGVSYHIAVTVDDHLQGITDVIRGEDLYPATAIHRVLQELLGFGAPNYRHHSLIRDAGEMKYSKSAGSQSLRAMREAGATLQDIRLQLRAAGGKI